MPRLASPAPTARQQRIYDYLVAFKREHDGNSPTIREIATFVGISSSSVANYHLKQLVRFGLIQFQAEGRSRMINVVGGTWNPPTPAGQ